jgi:hypothetical protein
MQKSTKMFSILLNLSSMSSKLIKLKKARNDFRLLSFCLFIKKITLIKIKGKQRQIIINNLTFIHNSLAN